MGETPEVVKIACPGCETQFRLKPKKGRLPQGPLPCPKCGESIPIVEENIRRNGPKRLGDASRAHAFSKAGEDKTTKLRNATVAGSPAKTPHRNDTIERDADEFDHIAVSPGLSESNPKSTFLGMGSALAAIEGPGKQSDKTAVVSDDILAKIRSESSVVEDDEEEAGAEAEIDATKEISKANNVFSRETSENTAVNPADLAQTTERLEEDDADKPAPGQMVLGKIKIKKKLKRTSRKTSSAQKTSQKSSQKKTSKRTAGVRAPSKPDTSDDTNKPSLSSLLKKARKNKGKLSIPRPESSSTTTDKAGADKAGADKSAEALDQALDDLASETARSFSKEGDETKVEKKASVQPPAFDSGDSSMIDLLRRRVAENQQPGAASERRGSGYIRLPTAEIQDVLGQGTYRLRVEDIVYEPIDKEGLTQLVKRGVLLGAEEIAEPDGDWMPIADHPVFLELRRKMAREAHDLLKQYGQPAKATDDKKDGDADLPGRRAELPAPRADLPGRVDELPTTAGQQADDLDDIPMLEAELEEEAEQAAQELFADFDEEDEVAPIPEAVEANEASQENAAVSSIELDHDALGIDEDDVEVDVESPASEVETGAMPAHKDATPARKGSMRTWIPLLAGAAVLAVIGLGLSPIGQPYVDQLIGQQTDEGSPAKAATEANTEAKVDPSAQIDQAVGAASSTLAGALEVDTADATLQASVAEELVEAGNFDAAARVMNVLWQQRKDDADFAAKYADTLMKAGRFADARQVAIDGMQLDSDAHDFAALFARAVQENPALQGFDAVDVSEEMVDAATLDSDGKRLVLRLTKDGAPTFRFTPNQGDAGYGWRASIASYRLCQIMICKFDVPRTQPARIDQATFEALTAALPKGSVDTSKLTWATEDGKKYVYGALQDAVAEPARFPIELTDLWRGWLNAGSGYDLETTPSKALAALEGHAQGFYAPLTAQLGEASLDQVAGELSSIFVFDFLTNNWARFQSGEDKWGTHLHAAGGRLVSLHNADAFQPRASTRIKGRFGWTSRYSKDTIASLRLMERGEVDEKLFPQASAAEKARLNVFWSQRDEVLERIDELTGVHGAKEVLAFE